MSSGTATQRNEQEHPPALPWVSGQDLGMYAWALGDLIQMGTPILESLRICGQVFPHPTLSTLSRDAYDIIMGGGSLVNAYQLDTVQGRIDPAFADVIQVGEETGTLDQVLEIYAARSLGESRRTLAQALGRSAPLVEFIDQFSLLQEVGLPIVTSLERLKSQGSLAAALPALNGMLGRVAEGSSLSHALEHPECKVLGLDPIFLAMIKAGEVGGVLDIAFGRLQRQAQPR